MPWFKTGATHYHRQSTCNQKFGCLEWLESRAILTVKRRGPWLLLTFPEILIYINSQAKNAFKNNIPRLSTCGTK